MTLDELNKEKSKTIDKAANTRPNKKDEHSLFLTLHKWRKSRLLNISWKYQKLIKTCYQQRAFATLK
jgi:hypothetical protein